MHDSSSMFYKSDRGNIRMKHVMIYNEAWEKVVQAALVNPKVIKKRRSTFILTLSLIDLSNERPDFARDTTKIAQLLQ